MLVVLVTAAAGYLLASRGEVDLVGLANLLLGAALSGGGSIVLNQVLERHHDRRMERTRHRPLPSGLIGVRSALVWGIFLSVAGTTWLAWTVNGLTAFLGGLCVVSYVLLYTPLKRVTTLNTAVGAVPGAIPPMMGFSAVTNQLGVESWVLFAILFFWQFPHFLAIAWIYREDYARAGYSMLSGVDPDGRMTARQIILNSSVLMLVSLLPTRLGFAGMGYAAVAILAGTGLMALGLFFSARRSRLAAVVVLKGSVVYISLLMTVLVVDKA